jgi:hypothetical protein
MMMMMMIIIIISCYTVLAKTLAASHRGFHNLIKTHGRTSWDKWSAPCKGLYLHRTIKHRNTKKNKCLERDSNPRSQQQAAKTCTLDCEATVTGINNNNKSFIYCSSRQNQDITLLANTERYESFQLISKLQ